MPAEREPIFHDRQIAFSISDQTTVSNDFVDIEGAALETGDLGSPGLYTSWFTFIVAASLANTIATFRVLVNDVPIVPEGRDLDIKTNNQDMAVTFMGLIPGLVSDDVIKLQWKTDKGTLTLEEFDMMIDGIPDIRVVQAGSSPESNTYLLETGIDSYLTEAGDFLLVE